MQQWTVNIPDADFAGLKLGDAPIPSVGDDEVLVRFHASSLNYRDLAIAKVESLWLNGFQLRTEVNLFYQYRIGHFSLCPQVSCCPEL